MPTKSFLVGFYRLPGVDHQVIVETPLTGHGPTDYKYLKAEVRKLYPKVPEDQIIKQGSTIEAREPDEQEWINPHPGMTLRQVFPADVKGEVEEYSRFVGSVFFSGSHCKVSLRYHVEKNTVGLVLIDRLNKQTTRFTEQFNGSLLLKDLPALLTEAFGSNSKDLRLRIKGHASDGQQAAKERVPDLKNQVPTP